MLGAAGGGGEKESVYVEGSGLSNSKVLVPQPGVPAPDKSIHTRVMTEELL